VLALLHVSLDVCPFLGAATGYEVVLNVRLTVNLLDELGNKLVNSILVRVVNEELNHTTNFYLGNTVVVQDSLLVIFVTLLELFTLLVELLLELLTELLLHLVRDMLEGVGLQDTHFVVDGFDSRDKATAGLLQSLLESHLDVEKVTLEGLDELEQVALVRVVVDRFARVLQHVSLGLDASENVLLLLFVCLDLAN